MTGRLSSSAPSLHGVPVRTPDGRRIREAFVAPPGHVIVAADYDQIELRIVAHVSGDVALTSAFVAATTCTLPPELGFSTVRSTL